MFYIIDFKKCIDQISFILSNYFILFYFILFLNYKRNQNMNNIEQL